MNSDEPTSGRIFSPLYLTGVISLVVAVFAGVWFLPDVLSAVSTIKTTAINTTTEPGSKPAVSTKPAIKHTVSNR